MQSQSTASPTTCSRSRGTRRRPVDCSIALPAERGAVLEAAFRDAGVFLVADRSG